MALSLGWTYLEEPQYNRYWVDISNFPIALGVIITLFYSKLPHMATITFFYTIGFGLYLLSILICFTGTYSCSIGFVSMLCQSSILVGLYLPFVTEAVINMLGRKNKALGSALIEMANAIALAISSFYFSFFRPSAEIINSLIVVLFLFAIFMQKKADAREKKMII